MQFCYFDYRNGQNHCNLTWSELNAVYNVIYLGSVKLMLHRGEENMWHVQLCFLCIIRTLTDAYSKSFQVSNLTHISLIRQLEYKLEVIICVQLIPGDGSSTNKHFVGYAIDVSHLAEILIFGLHSKKITFFGNSFFTIHICQELFQTVIAIHTGHLQCSE